jgi:hypothetical protein
MDIDFPEFLSIASKLQKEALKNKVRKMLEYKDN